MLDFDPFAEELFDDPFPIYRRLRDEAPDLYLERYDCFFLSRFEDVWRAVSDPSFSHRRGTTSMELLLGQPTHNSALSSLAPPAHTELRGQLAPAFLPGAVRRIEPRARKLVRGFLDEVLPRGEFDAVGDLALRLSARVAFLILGLPLADADEAATQVGASFDRTQGVRGPTEIAAEARERLQEYIAAALEERRRRPRGEGLIEVLLDAEVGGRKLTPDELVGNVYLMIVGGTETLPKVFSGALYQLWRHPDQRAELAADPGLVPDAFWEALRYEMPTLMLGASAEREATVCGGTRVRPGQKLMFLWVSANRDEREFPDPDRFDVRRRAPRILTFNHARHRCLGAHVAQMEGRVLLEELLARAPNYEVLEEKAVRIRSEFFRGFSSLPIRA